MWDDIAMLLTASLIQLSWVYTSCRSSAQLFTRWLYRFHSVVSFTPNSSFSHGGNYKTWYSGELHYKWEDEEKICSFWVYMQKYDTDYGSSRCLQFWFNCPILQIPWGKSMLSWKVIYFLFFILSYVMHCLITCWSPKTMVQSMSSRQEEHCYELCMQGIYISGKKENKI